jgi:hypothetical protein
MLSDLVTQEEIDGLLDDLAETIEIGTPIEKSIARRTYPLALRAWIASKNGAPHLANFLALSAAEWAGQALEMHQCTH